MLYGAVQNKHGYKLETFRDFIDFLEISQNIH